MVKLIFYFENSSSVKYSCEALGNIRRLLCPVYILYISIYIYILPPYLYGHNRLMPYWKKRITVHIDALRGVIGIKCAGQKKLLYVKNWRGCLNSKYVEKASDSCPLMAGWSNQLFCRQNPLNSSSLRNPLLIELWWSPWFRRCTRQGREKQKRH